MSDAFPRPTGRQPWDDPRPSGHDDRPLATVGPASGPADGRPPAEAPAAPAPDAPRAPATAVGDHAAEDASAGDGRARAPDEIEEAVPALERLRAVALRLWATARSSVPARTALFLLPPLVLPALSFDLSLGAALGVTLLLLWLAAAAGIVATMMFDGSDLLALRAIERRIDELAGASSPPSSGSTSSEEALLVVGAQLDALNDRLDALTAGAGARRPRPDVAVEHRPAEQWSPTPARDHNDGHDHDVAPGRHWSPSEWQR